MKIEKVTKAIEIIRKHLCEDVMSLKLGIKTDTDYYIFDLEDIQVIDLESILGDYYLVIATNSEIEVQKSVVCNRKYNFRTNVIESISIEVNYNFKEE